MQKTLDFIPAFQKLLTSARLMDYLIRFLRNLEMGLRLYF